ncbi:L-asparaginase 1-like [Megalops cyprinoides]|uniref:L-asparaginase 1-like n=1 Tax=Megalops cyprinoides TaxID=118141 RepID=UPI001863E6EF|nr:L-asparaginase 1-like [Megalops cyprinoides]
MSEIVFPSSFSEKATDDCPGNIQVLYHIEEVLKPIDSSKMLPQNWSDIANKILTEDRTHKYDGFIILHGTDTMAYTSSALSFLLHGKIRKPVVLTGAQRTLFEPRSDAVDNMLGSLLIAGCYAPLQQVSLFFDNKLFQGNRVTKFDSNSFEAFTSPKFKPLVEMGVDITAKERGVLFLNCCQVFKGVVEAIYNVSSV